jgi:hypothetical protein
MRPNLSKITSAQLRTFLRRHPYQRYGRVPYDVEYLYLETIPQVDVFYILCEELKRPPTQKEMVDRYLDLCRDEISKKGVHPDHVAKRIARAWATYIGELDFYCQVRDSGLFDQVICETRLDYELGYNLGIVCEGKTFYIHLYFHYKDEEIKAKKWLERKERRKAQIRVHLRLPDPIEFPLTDEDADLIGNLHLYKTIHVQKLRQMLTGRVGMPSLNEVLQRLKENPRDLMVSDGSFLSFPQSNFDT